jgi:hypothetical protein
MRDKSRRSLCPEYEIVNLNIQVNFDWDLFARTEVPLDKRTVTGVIKFK